MGEPEGKKALGQPTYRWEGNIKMDIKELDGRLGSGFIWLRVGRSYTLVNMVMNLQVP